jgi:hypothetical protein
MSSPIFSYENFLKDLVGLLVRKIFLRKKQNRDHTQERDRYQNLFWREKTADDALSRSAGEISQSGGDHHEESPCDARYRFVARVGETQGGRGESAMT